MSLKRSLEQIIVASDAVMAIAIAFTSPFNLICILILPTIQ